MTHITYQLVGRCCAGSATAALQLLYIYMYQHNKESPALSDGASLLKHLAGYYVICKP